MRGGHGAWSIGHRVRNRGSVVKEQPPLPDGFGAPRRTRTENRDSPVGVAFSRDLDCDLYDSNDLNDSNG